jgi:hypothetical protein
VSKIEDFMVDIDEFHWKAVDVKYGYGEGKWQQLHTLLREPKPNEKRFLTAVRIGLSTLFVPIESAALICIAIVPVAAGLLVSVAKRLLHGVMIALAPQ